MFKFKKYIFVAFVFLPSLSWGQQPPFRHVVIPSQYASKVDSVLQLMTLDEKIGQMNQYTGNFLHTGPVIDDSTKLTKIQAGSVGSMLNIKGVDDTRRMQELVLKSRLRIPLVFGLDVIHGMRTIYPIPLGEAASFDLDLMRRTAAGAAQETAAQGVHWTFAPMVDVSRDARWGRVMEGAGEDTWYGAKVATARVSGFQGKSLSDVTTIMACAKHFAAYGACIAGMDYNTVDLSEETLHDTYLPPFRAAVEAGVGSFMNSFNEINGLPSTANAHIQRDILRDSWQFTGFTVSDWSSIAEMIQHGYSPNLKEACYDAITGGCDMDMESRAYVDHLKQLILEGRIDVALVDDAVRRILLKKFELGLFDDPFRYCNKAREQQTVLSQPLRALALESGQKSIVLLKNEHQTLPLLQPQRIAVVGALANSQIDMLGAWANEGVVSEVVTLYEGIKRRFKDAEVSYAEGYDLATSQLLDTDQLIASLSRTDVVVVAVGERAAESGESKSKSDIRINEHQQRLVQTLKRSGKRVVVVLMGGRPLIFDDLTPHADAILMTWWLGTEAGNAIATVLAGDYAPTGKLPMTFPQRVGQCPIYYNHKSTGRPGGRDHAYTTRYIDVSNDPAYPFGFGLTYTSFEIGAPSLDKAIYKRGDVVRVTVSVKNTGLRAGAETIQLYLRDIFARTTRPVQELRGFQRVRLRAGEQSQVVFELHAPDLGYLNSDLQFVVESGDFEVLVGGNSRDVKRAKFALLND